MYEFLIFKSAYQLHIRMVHLSARYLIFMFCLLLFCGNLL